MDKKKLLFISHIDWMWIKQRPQFMGEALSKYYDITVMYPYRYNKKGYQRENVSTGIDVIPMYRIPRIDRYEALAWINRKINKWLISSRIKKLHPDYVYLTFPSQVDEIPAWYTGKIIYDCMDNHIEFYQDKQKREMLWECEQRMTHRADKILCTSQRLLEVLAERYGDELREKTEVCRNAYNGEIRTVEESTTKSELFTFCYFGTISDWFNFDYLTRSLQEFDNIKYLLMGPLDNTQIPKDDRIQYIGTVEHNKLYDVVKDTDCFIMPFIPNELIQSVDPVKFYEYINFNKNILTVKYKEIERFDEFVFFYEDYESFAKQIATLIELKDTKYDKQKRVEFLENNTWAARAKQVSEVMDAKNEEVK